jgi:hypothetical protein
MKKNLFYLFALICSMSLFTACSDDDEAPGNSGVVGEVVGDYKGLMDVYYEDPDLEIAKDMQQKITIKKSSDTSIGLELKDFVITINNTPLPIGDIAVENCPLKVEGDKYLFTGNADLDLIVGKCAVSVEGAINGEAIELIIKVNVDNGSMKVRVEYKGHKMTGNESSEALIKEFKFDSDIIAEQPVINEDKTITFKVAETATDDDLKALKPIITISENATITPESGVAQDFSGNKVVIYKVTSEDGTTVTEYKVSARKSSDALITSFVFENNPIVAEQPVINEDNTITFKVKASATADDLKALVPTITYSHKATIAPESGVAQDFSDNKHVSYIVTSEDGTVTKKYDVYVSEVVEDRFIYYNFDEPWQPVSDDPSNLDKTWPSPSPINELASANQGVQALKSMMNYTGDFAMLQETPGYNGSINAVKLQTIKSKGLNAFGIVNAPAITPGTLFTGSFVYSYAAGLSKEGQLGMTHFGRECNKKPILFRGAYKYKKGTNYIDGSKATGAVTGWKPNEWPENLPNEDKGLIIAVLFEVENADDHLDGNNLMDESKHVMRAIVGGNDYISDTNGEWKTFEIPFEKIGAYDPAKQYKLAIVCQSSKDGADFKGAENSTLIVDELEVIGE